MIDLASKIIILILCLTTSLVCNASDEVKPSDAERGNLSYGAWGFDASGQDKTTKSGDDFFRFANGYWLDHTDIPADMSAQSLRLEMTDRIEQRLHEMLENLAVNVPHEPSKLEEKLGAFYRAFMDEDRKEKFGSKPIQSLLEKIQNAKSHDQLAALMGQSMSDFTESIFNIDIYEDQKNPSHNAVYLSQGALGLPDRDYFLKSENAEKKLAYQSYIAQMLHLINWRNADEGAKNVIQFESKIASVSWTKVQQRDLATTYNSMKVVDLDKKYRVSIGRYFLQMLVCQVFPMLL